MCYDADMIPFYIPLDDEERDEKFTKIVESGDFHLLHKNINESLPHFDSIFPTICENVVETVCFFDRCLNVDFEVIFKDNFNDEIIMFPVRTFVTEDGHQTIEVISQPTETQVYNIPEIVQRPESIVVLTNDLFSVSRYILDQYMVYSSWFGDVKKVNWEVLRGRQVVIVDNFHYQSSSVEQQEKATQELKQLTECLFNVTAIIISCHKGRA